MRTLHQGSSWGMRRVTGALLTIIPLSQPLAAQFGELPLGHVSRHALEGVRAEIEVFFFIDSADVATYVPAGLRLVTLQQVASRDTVTAQYLASRPRLKTAVPSILAFVALDSFKIDDRPPIPSVEAFWWLPVGSAESLDERARGRSYVEVAYWSSDTSFVRLLRPHWPQLQYAPVTMERLEDGEWRLALTLPDGVIHNSCRPSGVREPASYPLPAYSTVWSAGPQPVTFTTYTYYGHHSQDCVGTWTTEGSSLLAAALMNSLLDPPPWMKTSLEDGWHARAGLYRR